MLNKIIIMGRITADIVMKKTNADKEYTNFSVAVDQPPRNGEKKTDFFRCTAWAVQLASLADTSKKVQ